MNMNYENNVMYADVTQHFNWDSGILFGQMQFAGVQLATRDVRMAFDSVSLWTCLCICLYIAMQ